MRAKTVNFQRGLDPKEALEIGNENLRQFHKDMDNGNFLAPLHILMDGLERGYISDKEADEFIIGAVRTSAPRYWEWTKWFEDTRNIYWSEFNESLNINFTLPDFKRIKTWIGKITEHDGGYWFKMRTSSTDKNGNGYGIETENVFSDDDYAFTSKFILNQINRVFTETVRNID